MIIMQFEQINYYVIPWRNKGKESYTNWLFNTSSLICKEGPDVNNFKKSFANILNWVLSSELYSGDYFSQIFNQCFATFHK